MVFSTAVPLTSLSPHMMFQAPVEVAHSHLRVSNPDARSFISLTFCPAGVRATAAIAKLWAAGVETY